MASVQNFGASLGFLLLPFQILVMPQCGNLDPNLDLLCPTHGSNLHEFGSGASCSISEVTSAVLGQFRLQKRSVILYVSSLVLKGMLYWNTRVLV